MSDFPLEFTVIPNHLSNDGRYMARIVNQKKIGFENLLDDTETDTALTKDDIRLALIHFNESVKKYLKWGFRVHTPLGTFRPGIKGSFANDKEDFRPFAESTNHGLLVTFIPDRQMESEVVKGLAPERVAVSKILYPLITRYTNLNSPEGDTFKASDIISVSGENLKIDTEADDEGLFWTDPQGDKTPTPLLINNTPKHLEFQIPDLAPGTYTLTIATRIGNHKLRETTFDDPIVIS